MALPKLLTRLFKDPATGTSLTPSLQHSAIPAGSLMHYAGKTAPDGWLICDGRAVSRTAYADLFAAIGTLYGAGDGSTTFNLPNPSGRYLQAVTASDDVGTTQQAGLPNVTGMIQQTDLFNGTSWGTGAFYRDDSIGNYDYVGVVSKNRQATRWLFDASRSSAVYGRSTTVTPETLKAYLLIKV